MTHNFSFQNFDSFITQNHNHFVSTPIYTTRFSFLLCRSTFPHTQGNEHLTLIQSQLLKSNIQLIILQIQIMQSSLFGNPVIHQNECFVCNKGGHVQMCDSCPRVYHQMCQQLRLNQQKLYECQVDSELRQCQFCSQIPEQNCQIVKCTICFRNAHLNCYWHPLYIMNKDNQSQRIEDEREQLIYNYKSYVCKQCFHRNGIRQIVRTQKFSTSKNFVVEQFIIGLVHINYKSLIHYGWFSQQDIRKSFTKQRQNRQSNKKRQGKILQNRIIQTKPVIEKILAMRLPSRQAQINDSQVFELLKDSERINNLRFGDTINFKFLVKWLQRDYCMATWQDQLTVRLIDKQSKLQQFIQSRQQMSSNDLELTFKPDTTRYNHYLQNLIEQSQNNHASHFDLQNYKQTYSMNIAINDQHNKGITTIIQYLKLYYCAKKESDPTLLIVPKQKMKLWENELIKNRNLLKYLIFSGNERSIELIKATEFDNIQKYDFEVLIVSYQHYKLHRSFLQEKIEQFHEIIMTSFYKPNFIEDLFSLKKKEEAKQLRSRLMFIIDRVINNKFWEEEIARKICAYFEKNTILKHTLSWSEIEIVNCNKAKNSYTQNGVHFNYKPKQHHLKMQPFSQQQRLIFLNYTLRFGFIPTNTNALYDRIYSTDKYKELFNNVQESKNSFRKYVKTFYHLLIIHKKMEIPQPTINYYLFGCNPHQVTKRIVQLYRLKCLLNTQFFNFNINPPLIRSDNGQVIGQLNNWNNRNDYMLAQLIIRQGYGNWDKIMKNTSYGQYCEKKQDITTPYLLYLKVVLIFFRKKKIQPLEFIESRANTILQRMSEL